ncbi:hypothetical protein Dsin_024217 [Dipteronia sinensis]|uniref:Uncharacterized protein n=1 Tax=Dipteronia sinensis TaxID=43782 RepID=A0AAD9ZTJ9_9ROSI|nr:hypothetical protein Dsin_024217 [Dipteronia sinensis]
MPEALPAAPASTMKLAPSTPGKHNPPPLISSGGSSSKLLQLTKKPCRKSPCSSRAWMEKFQMTRIMKFTSVTYIGNYSGEEKREITGVLYHEMTHMATERQWPGTRRVDRGIGRFYEVKGELCTE